MTEQNGGGDQQQLLASAQRSKDQRPHDVVVQRQQFEEDDDERMCWVCYSSCNIGNTKWCRPCYCRGTMGAVHESCILRWIEELRRNNPHRPVQCAQCGYRYRLIRPRSSFLYRLIVSIENYVDRISPTIASGIILLTIYWNVCCFGVLAAMEVMGENYGMEIIENGDPTVLFVEIPCLTLGAFLLPCLKWENLFVYLLEKGHKFGRRIGFIHGPVWNNPNTSIINSISLTNIICTGLILPTISNFFGRLLFSSIEAPLQRATYGAATFIIIKGCFHLYLRLTKMTTRIKRRILSIDEVLRQTQ